ncbi:MAG: NADH-quinone oxidoreductase subunit A [bacterium]
MNFICYLLFSIFALGFFILFPLAVPAKSLSISGAVATGSLILILVIIFFLTWRQGCFPSR